MAKNFTHAEAVAEVAEIAKLTRALDKRIDKLFERTRGMPIREWLDRMDSLQKFDTFAVATDLEDLDAFAGIMAGQEAA